MPRARAAKGCTSRCVTEDFTHCEKLHTQLGNFLRHSVGFFLGGYLLQPYKQGSSPPGTFIIIMDECTVLSRPLFIMSWY